MPQTRLSVFENKKDKPNKRILFGLVLMLVLVISISAFAQAHSSTTNDDDWEERMDEMHDWMTNDLDSETKKELDEVHERCMGG